MHIPLDRMGSAADMSISFENTLPTDALLCAAAVAAAWKKLFYF